MSEVPHDQVVTDEQGTTPTMYDYPGLGLPRRFNEYYETAFYPIAAHGNNYGSQSGHIFVCELAMMNVIGKLSDKQDWHKKVFDDGIVEKWKKEALAIPNKEVYKFATVEDIDKRQDCILSEQAFYYREILREDWRRTHLLRCLTLSSLMDYAEPYVNHTLKANHEASPDWNPNTNGMVQDLVHPSMYSLVYGRIKVFQKECVGVEDAVELWAGRGTVLPVDNSPEEGANQWSYRPGGSRVPPEYWSGTYQWLPANVASGGEGNIKFTSYIHNLDPMKYVRIYRTIEKLIEKPLPLWNQCLAMVNGGGDTEGAGRMGTRMDDHDGPDDEQDTNWVPDNPEECIDVEVDEEDLADIIDEYGYGKNTADPNELAVCK